MSAKRTDANQAAIVAELRQAGCSVQDLHEVGKGCPDIVCGYAGHTWIFEIKTDKGALTEDEKTWALRWRGQYAVIHTTEEALEIMGLLRRTL